MTATQVQFRRGTAAQIATFTGAQGEVVVDTTNNRVVVQDGATAGGFPAAKLSEVLATVPAPGPATLGGLFANSGATSKWIRSVNTDGTVSLSQPTYSDLVAGYPGPHFAVLNPSGTKSSTAFNTSGLLANCHMLGFNVTFTPSRTGICFVGLWGQGNSTTANDTDDLYLLFGTGTPPSSGVAPTGTAVSGNSCVFSIPSASFIMPLSMMGVVTLTAGTTYWFDGAMGSRTATATTTNLFNASIVVLEF